MSPEAFAALMLFENADIDNSQRISVLAAATHSNENISGQSTNEEYTSTVSYNFLPPALRQCVRPKSKATERAQVDISRSAATNHQRYNHSNFSDRGLTNAERNRRER